jgi:hypothetical protein
MISVGKFNRRDMGRFLMPGVRDPRGWPPGRIRGPENMRFVDPHSSIPRIQLY